MNNNMDKEIIEIPLNDIIPNRFQPRISFDEEELNELAKSIRQHGIIQPLVLRKIKDKYEIIAGERRYKAAFIAGLTKVPAVVLNLDDNESAEVAIVENIQRKNLSPMEEAKSYKKLLDRGYLKQDELASRMGKTQGFISNKLRLLNLSEPVQIALLNNKISERHARSLLKVEDPDKQQEILNLIINNKLNVKDTDKLINEYLNDNIYVVNNGKTLGGKKQTNTYDFDDFFKEDENLIEDKTYPEIEDKTYPSIEDKIFTPIEDKTYPEIPHEEALLLEDEKDDNKKEILNDKIKKFVEELKNDGYISTYDSYEFDNMYEFIIKINKKDDK